MTGMVAGMFVELKCNSLGVQSASLVQHMNTNKHNSHSE